MNARIRNLVRYSLLAGLALTACSRGEAPPELAVYAAASLRDVLGELAPRAEGACGASLVFNFGASSDLARQIVAGGQADLFLSADEKEMDRIAAEGLVDVATRRALLSNQLAVIEAADAAPSAFSSPFDAGQLAGPAVTRLSLAEPATVPAGRYARAWLESKGVWEDVAGRVLPAVDVRAAMAAVESGAAEAGIVYRTDAARSARVRAVHAVPVEEGPKIVYPVAVVARGKGVPAARALLEFLAGPEASDVFRRHGFAPIPTSGG